MLRFSELPSIVPESELISKHDFPVHHLLYDSRKLIVSESSIFFAFKSSRRDGHDFIPDLYEKGIRQFVVNKSFNHEPFPEAGFLLVDEPVIAMQHIAAWHRRQFDYPVIGITGSNGKTIVKEWLSSVLSGQYQIVKSPRSFNSQIGVPLSVWQMNAGHTLGIFEAGISRTGEMVKLEKVIKPDIGIFTNIGPAHAEGFEDQEQKIEEKLILFKDAKLVIYNSDQADVKRQIERSGLKSFSWGIEGEPDLKVLSKSTTSISATFQGVEFALDIPFKDSASFENVMHCVATMLYFGIPMEKVEEKVSRLRPLKMRLELKEGIHNSLLIDDAYNNDIAGLTTALSFLEQQKQKPKKSLILSDLFEYGTRPEDLYKEISEIIDQKELDLFIGIGPEMSQYKNLFKVKSEFYASTESFLSGFDFNLLSDHLILVKGARTFQFEKIVQSLTGKLHGTILEINLDALTNNLNYYRSKLKPETRVMVMVKAFAYGSGSAEVASLLQFHKVDYLGVAYADEGVRLREQGITIPIMVMNPSVNSFSKMLEYNLEPEIYNFKLLDEFLSMAQRIGQSQSIHVKLDTGMHRLGFESKDLHELIQKLEKNKEYLHVQSVFTHLAGADEEIFNDFTINQLNEFDRMASEIENKLAYTCIKHALNSAGIVRFPDKQMDMVRLGIGLYGVEATGLDQQELLPVGTFKTTISQIKEVSPGETVGYSRKGKVSVPKKIATIAVGYADGYDRRFGNGVGKVLINETLCPIIGNVCMDMSMVDITGVEANEGDQVILFGQKPTIIDCAQDIGTIPYEILTNVGERVKRIFYSE